MSFNDQIIEAFRANHGVVTDPVDFGRGLVLVHVPRKDGTEVVVPLASVTTDDGWYVVASAAGSPKNPAWTYGLRRTETTRIEIPGDPIETVPVTVTELVDDERDAMWARFTKMSSGFAEYEKTAEGRVFPIFRFTSA